MQSQVFKTTVLAIASLAGASAPRAQTIDEVAILQATGAITGEQYAWTVAVSGPVLVVGAHGDSTNGYFTGAAYVYERDAGGQWIEVAKLFPDDPAEDDRFGFAVAVSDELIIVGAPGNMFDLGSQAKNAAYIFERGGGSWSQVAKLEATDDAPGRGFGCCVGIEGDAAIVGAKHADDLGTGSGAAYAFAEVGGAWQQSAKLLAGDGAAGAFFGRSVAISGDRIVVGAHQDDELGLKAGAAYVYERFSKGFWIHEEKLLSESGEGGDQFGYSVNIDGERITIGALVDDNGGLDAGSVQAFEIANGVWTQTADLVPTAAAPGATAGHSVTIDGDLIVCGAPTGAIQNEGFATVFLRDASGVWSEFATLFASQPSPDARFGFSVSLDGSTLAIGAQQAGITTQAETVYVFDTSEFVSVWEDKGCALAGVEGEPQLSGYGDLVVGSANAVVLANAASFSVAGHFIGFASTPIPFKGGLLKPFPFLPPVFLATNSVGEISIPFTMPAGVPPATEIWVQFGINDAEAINGVALSNAILGITP